MTLSSLIDELLVTDIKGVGLAPAVISVISGDGVAVTVTAEGPLCVDRG